MFQVNETKMPACDSSSVNDHLEDHVIFGSSRERSRHRTRTRNSKYDNTSMMRILKERARRKMETKSHPVTSSCSRINLNSSGSRLSTVYGVFIAMIKLILLEQILSNTAIQLVASHTTSYYQSQSQVEASSSATTASFSCGKLYYRTFHLDQQRNVLYVGAM